MGSELNKIILTTMSCSVVLCDLLSVDSTTVLQTARLMKKSRILVLSEDSFIERGC